MAMERITMGPALSAYLDEVTPIPEHIAARYEEHASHPAANMMTHADVGRLLSVLARTNPGGRALEIGTFVGISSAWIADGLGDEGRIDTLEADHERAAEAERWLERVGLASTVRVHRGPAVETLSWLTARTYDLCYVDADKTGYPLYLEHAVRLVRPGGWIVADNAFAQGRVSDPDDDEGSVLAIRRFTRSALATPRLMTAVLSIGDGITLSLRLP